MICIYIHLALVVVHSNIPNLFFKPGDSCGQAVRFVSESIVEGSPSITTFLSLFRYLKILSIKITPKCGSFVCEMFATRSVHDLMNISN